MNISESQLLVCIVSPNIDAYSETFIHNHINNLPLRVWPVFGSSIENLRDGTNDTLIWSRKLPEILKNNRYLRYLAKHAYSKYRINAFKEFLLENNISAVLAEYGIVGVGVMEDCQDAKVPLIVHFHGFDAYYKDILKGRGLEYPRLFNIASAIVAVSIDMVRQLVDLGAPAEKIQYNPYGIDLSSFGGAQPSKSPPTFLFVGRFVEKKAPDLTLRAFSKIQESIAESKLIMIGDGPMLEACQTLVKSLDLVDSVEFPGVVAHREIPDYMKRSRAYVQHSVRPSSGDSEGTPVAILEASGSGLPVVSTYHAGIPDVIIHGETGFLVEEYDIDGMASYMIKLAQNADLAETLGLAGRIRIEAKFSSDVSLNNLAQIIQNAIAG